jgi:hypothetical protein
MSTPLCLVCGRALVGDHRKCREILQVDDNQLHEISSPLWKRDKESLAEGAD